MESSVGLWLQSSALLNLPSATCAQDTWLFREVAPYNHVSPVPASAFSFLIPGSLQTWQCFFHPRKKKRPLGHPVVPQSCLLSFPSLKVEEDQ